MEHSFIAWVKHRASRLKKVKLGIGDDCAILAPRGVGASHESEVEDWVVTTDSLCDGTHFILSECGPRAAGRKLIAVNLSDLASMGAVPDSVFLSMCLPRKNVGDKNAGDIAAEIFEGVYELAEKFNVSIAGGDTNLWDGPLAIHMTAIGNVRPGNAWLRSGANPGDAIVVSGALGGSILKKHLEFTPRLELAAALRELGCVSAATDISDGLGVDLLNLTVASKCGAEVDLSKIPISDDAKMLSMSSGKTPLDHALGDGEDFELLMAVPQEKISKLPAVLHGIPLTVVGNFVSRTGLWCKERGGVKQLSAKGYIHS